VRNQSVRTRATLTAPPWQLIAAMALAALVLIAVLFGDSGGDAGRTTPLPEGTAAQPLGVQTIRSDVATAVGMAMVPATQVTIEGEPAPVVLQPAPPPIPVPDLPDVPNPFDAFDRLSPKRLAADLLEALLTTIGEALLGAIRSFVDWALGLGDSSLNFVTRTPAAGTYGSPTVRSLWDFSRAVANAGLALVIMWGGFGVMVKQHTHTPQGLSVIGQWWQAGAHGRAGDGPPLAGGVYRGARPAQPAWAAPSARRGAGAGNGGDAGRGQ